MKDEMNTLNTEQARSLIRWALEKGLTVADGYEAVAAALIATEPKETENKKEGAEPPSK